MSLKTKVAGLVLLLFLASIWVLTYSLEHRLSQDMQQVLENQQFSTVSYIASDLDYKVRQRIDLLNTVAGSITPETLVDPAQALEFLRTRYGLQSLFRAGLILVARDGQGIADYPHIPGRAKASYAEIEFYKEVMATGKTSLDKPHIGRFSQQPVIAIAAPVKDTSGRILALLVGTAFFSDNTLFGQVENAQVGETGYIAINAPKYRLIATSSKASRRFQSMAEPGVNKMLDRFLAGYEGSGITVNSLGIENLTSSKQIPSAGWIAQIVLPTQEAFAPIRAMRTRAYILAAVLSVFVLSAVWLVVRHLLAPLSRASSSVREMSPEELQSLPVERRDEIGILLENFNLLVDKRRQTELALRDSERFVRTVADNIPGMVGYWTSELRCGFANSAYLEWFGRTPEQMQGIGTRELMGEELFRQNEPHMRAALQGTAQCFERTLTRADGSTRHILIHYIPDLVDGSVQGFFVLATDITEVKAAQLLLETRVAERTEELRRTVEELEASKTRAESANRMKTEFLANLSHELRTPLNPILGLTELLLGTELSVTQRDYLQDVREAGQNLLNLLNRLISLVTLESYIPAPTIVGPSSLLELAVRSVATAAQTKGLTLEGRLAPELPPAIWLDLHLLCMALLEIVDNAVRFTSAGSVSIELSLAVDNAGQDQLCIEVRDTGIGIPEDRLAAISSGLTQGDNPLTKRFGGLGVGMAKATKALDLLGGQLEIDSRPGQGTLMRILLPLKPADLDLTGT